MTDTRPTSYIWTLEEALTDSTCGMRYWYQTQEAGRGIKPTKDLLTQEMLDTTLKDIRTVQFMAKEELLPSNLDDAIKPILNRLTDADRNNSMAMQLLYRRLGWFVSNALHHEHKLRSLYDEIPLDEELLLDRDPLYLTMRSGRLLRNRVTGEIIYVLYVPASSTSFRWRTSWAHHIRPQAEMAAAMQATNGKVDCCQVMGFDLGLISTSTGEILYHPYTHGYYNEATQTWSASRSMAHVEGWKERPTWEYPAGIVSWVMFAGIALGEQQWPVSAKIVPNQKMLDAWIDTRTQRGRFTGAVRLSCHSDRDSRIRHFPHNPTVCYSGDGGEVCPYINACWNKSQQSPLLTGLFTPVAALELEKVGGSLHCTSPST